MPDETCAHVIRVRGVVQGVGFRPFVFRLTGANGLGGWVLNEDEGVEIHVEGKQAAVEAFLRVLKLIAPSAAVITTIEVIPVDPLGIRDFTIRASERRGRPAARISPDLPICSACLGGVVRPFKRALSISLH